MYTYASGTIWWGISVVVTGAVFGWLVRRDWRTEDKPWMDRLVLNSALGLGLLSLVIFACCALRAVPGVVTGILFVGVSILVALPLFLANAAFSAGRWFAKKQWPSWKMIFWVAAFLCLAFYLLIPALAPPSGSDWDSLAYHLSVPKTFLEHGGFRYIDFMSHSNFPMLVEMLYLPALSVGSPAGAKMVHYLYGVLLVLAVVVLVRKHFPSPLQRAQGAPVLAALAVAGMPIVMWEATTAYIDLATALYTVVAVYLLLDYLDKPELKTLIWCGVAAGFTASTKMTGLTLAPMLAVWLVVDRMVGRRKAGAEGGQYGMVIWHALALVGVALLVCSPWYIKTLIYTGNPVYPFFYSIFGGKDWTAELAQNYTALQARFGVGHGPGAFALLPVDLTFRAEEFYDTPGLYVGPILLVAVPLMFAARNWSRKLKGLALFFLAQMVTAFVLTQQARYLIPALAIVAVITAAIAYSEERFRLTRVALYVTFSVTALFGMLVMLPMVTSSAPVVFGRETQDEYLLRTLAIYAPQKWINENTPRDAKVALFGDTRAFYLDRDYVWADWGHNRRLSRRYASLDEFVRFLKSQGITHAVVNFKFLPGEESATRTAKRVYEAIEQGRFEPVTYAEHAVGVYEIR